MTANELRIGNYLYSDIIVNPTAVERQVIKINASYIYNAEVYKDKVNLFPIPLTEEWLLKFGFSEKEPHLFSIKINIEPIDYLELWVNKARQIAFIINTFGEEEENEHQSLTIKKDLNHVHQLQNLYFALTGKELEYART